MMTQISINLHAIAKFTNLAIPALAALFFMAGYGVSFYFHFLTVTFLFLTVVNLFYRHVQTKHALLRNFGILGQARYLIESIGPELRQYLYANDTEERPFTREERSEVYRQAKKIDSAFSFGSQSNYDATEIKLRHSMFPASKTDLEPFRVVFGEERGLANAFAISRPAMISAMSFGALSADAIRALARGAKLAGIPMNTGEGGYPKYHLKEEADLIFQIGTAKFGVRREDGSLDDARLAEIAALPQVKMIEIKLSQGAKPGKGGLLPKEKISDEIAHLRGVPQGKDVVSPPHHIECDNPANTVKFIERVQSVSGLPVGVKLCLGVLPEFEAFVDEMKRQGAFPDYLAIDGAEGGTGAAPKAFMDYVGMPLMPALYSVTRTLEEKGARDRLKLVGGGKLINAGRQLVAMALGANAIYTARGFMLALGCIQALQCGKNTCPVGITTHDPQLTAGLVVASKAVRVRNYAEALHREFMELLAAAGCRSARELSFDRLYTPGDSILAYECGIVNGADRRPSGAFSRAS